MFWDFVRSTNTGFSVIHVTLNHSLQQKRQGAEARQVEPDWAIAVVDREEQGRGQWGNHAASYLASPGKWRASASEKSKTSMMNVVFYFLTWRTHTWESSDFHKKSDLCELQIMEHFVKIQTQNFFICHSWASFRLFYISQFSCLTGPVRDNWWFTLLRKESMRLWGEKYPC